MPSSSAPARPRSRVSTRTLADLNQYLFDQALTDNHSPRIDVSALKTYQQVYIYIIPIISNLGFINIIVVVVRLRWFEKHLRSIGKTVPRLPNNSPYADQSSDTTAPGLLNPEPPTGRTPDADAEAARSTSVDNRDEQTVSGRSGPAAEHGDSVSDTQMSPSQSLQCLPTGESSRQPTTTNEDTDTSGTLISRTIQFGDDVAERGQSSKALYIPPPWKRDRGNSRQELSDSVSGS